tara:strand:- start:523 stop:735 length:213 start_codon:yes stop_codon:yes gene_type:complete
METNENASFQPNINDLVELLNEERENNNISNNCLKTIQNIIIEGTPNDEKLKKIQARIMRYKYELGENSN